jgi:hypothetical protein
MARLEVALAHRTLQSTGDLVLHAEPELEAKTDQGTWEALTSRVDPGTEMTTMPAATAKSLDLPIPKRPTRGLALHGHEVRRGLLRARIPGLDATEYVFPCYILGDPNVPLVGARNLLSLTGVVDKIRLSFDGTPAPGALYGLLIVEKI